MYYVYRITCAPTGEFYYGARYRHVKAGRTPEEDLWNYYFTSSKMVKRRLDEYGKDCFVREIIFRSISEEECFFFEQQIIKDNIHLPLCLNMRFFDPDKNVRIISVLGKTLPTKGRPKTEATKTRMRKPKSAAHRRVMSERQKARGGNGPSHHTNETKEKIRASGTGRKQSPETCQKIGDALRGKPKPTSTCPHCGKTGNRGPMNRFHFNNCKQIKSV